MLQSWKEYIFFYCNSNFYVFSLCIKLQTVNKRSISSKEIKRTFYVLQAHLKGQIQQLLCCSEFLSYFHPAPHFTFSSQSMVSAARHNNCN